MKYLVSFLQFCGCVIFSLSSLAQTAGNLEYSDAVFNPDIKSVQLFSEGSVLSIPVLTLGTDERLLLKFDDLSGESRNYSYTILHCDAEWNESYVIQSEYLNGFVENPLEDYALSFNTTVNYTNYQLSIPNDRVQINYSGNYILLVYEDGDREKLVLSRRFYVLNPKVEIAAEVKRATFDPYNGDNQEVDFAISHPRLRIVDPFQEIKVVVMKNRRWDSSIRDLKPLFVRENQLVYNYDKENVFAGGNEFRYFDIRSWTYNGENVAKIEQFQGYNHVTLSTDEIRSNKKYFNYRELNGNYTIESQDRINDPDTECDYGFVHFTLAVPVPLVGGSVNVFGALTEWSASEKNEMSWIAERKQYELTLLLKQGYYNFQYVYVPQGGKQADETVLEGSHVETENDYQIFVYYRGFSGRFDELVGFHQINSKY